jgi:hypothetical protein
MWHFPYHGNTKAKISTEFLKDSSGGWGFAEECIK